MFDPIGPMARTRQSHDYWRWRGGPASSWLIGDLGYVSVCARNGGLWIDDAAIALDHREALWGALRALAGQLGQSRIAGWLPDELADGQWLRSDREACIPMVRGVDATRASFWSVDAF